MQFCFLLSSNYLSLVLAAATVPFSDTSKLSLDALTFVLTLLSEASLLLLLLTGCRLLPSLLASQGLLLLRSAQLLGYSALPALGFLKVGTRVVIPALLTTKQKVDMYRHRVA